MSNAVIGIGTNLGDRYENIKRAVKAITILPETSVVSASHIYETAPVGKLSQGDFLNACILVKTKLSPLSLLGACFGIEASLGRVRTEKNGPRVIDLDLLLYEGFKSESFELTLPHPRILERAFVMLPLSDIYPGGRAPGLYYAPYLKEVSSDGVRLVEGLEIDF